MLKHINLKRLNDNSLFARVDDLDEDILTELRKHKTLLKCIADWYTFPDRKLLPFLIEMSKIVNDLYRFNETVTLYRGFNLLNAELFNQNILEHSVDEFVAKKYRKGDKVKYSGKYPVSFSTNPNVPKRYGDIIVSTVVDLPETKSLVLTEEIIFLIKELNLYSASSIFNLLFFKFMFTSREVIVLPPFDLDCTFESISNMNFTAKEFKELAEVIRSQQTN